MNTKKNNFITRILEKIKNSFNSINSIVSKEVLSNNQGKKLQSLIAFLAVGLISGYMTIINRFTSKTESMFLTAVQQEVAFLYRWAMNCEIEPLLLLN